MKMAGKEGTMKMVIDKGYRIPWVFMNYAQSMIEGELPKYRKRLRAAHQTSTWIANRVYVLDAYPDYIAWLEQRLKHFKTKELLGL